MAVHEETIVTYVDDITGEAGEDVKMYSFGMDETWYEIDLSDATAKKTVEKFRDAVLEHARVAEVQDKSQPEKPAKRSAGNSRTSAELADVRQWASENGVALSPKGRIPKSVWDAYDAAPANV